jgi:hypothetical protein
LLTPTQHNLEKVETLLKQMGFKVRYEKGNFKTGACVLQNSKVIVVNRFLDLEAKINALIELLNTLNINEGLVHLDEKQKQLFLGIRQKKLEI